MWWILLIIAIGTTTGFICVVVRFREYRQMHEAHVYMSHGRGTFTEWIDEAQKKTEAYLQARELRGIEAELDKEFPGA